jgi:uncharacterized protein (DUF2147 family)
MPGQVVCMVPPPQKGGFVARMVDRMSAGAAGRRHSVWSCSLHCRILLIAALTLLAFSHTTSWATVPQGVWLMDARVAVQIYSCADLLCGRILWLQIPRDPQGRLDRDKNNPEPALQQRPLCGLTVLWNLHSAGPQHWEGGWFYNPENGKTYNVSAQLKSADVLIARIYLGNPFFGETKTLIRVPHGTSKGWC